MCLICVEYYYKRMTKDELKNALPEMVMFAKNEKERNHYKKLQSLDTAEELAEEVSQHFSKYVPQDDYKASYRFSKSRKL